MTLPPSKIATCERHYETAPQLIENGVPTWIARGVNIVTAVSEALTGTTLGRDNPDEYMVALCPGVIAEFHAAADVLTAEGPSLVIVPPGRSRIRVTRGGRLARIFTTRTRDLAALAANAGNYAEGFKTQVAPLVDWPAPKDGFRLRSYALDPFGDPQGPRIQPRVFRSTNLMVNAFVPWRSRRDPHDLSPHWHDDFEQVSLGLQGDFIHHIRYPWTSDSTLWRADEHIFASSPSAAIIPPPLVHTTQDVGTGEAWLIDVFSPPRLDFASRPGFVLNEADYPLPPDANSDMSRSGGIMMGWQKGL
ncbi:hypothetical protein ACEUZ9_003248 [Paracoccus litorisediminis]|uniref:hypothetical protein n=1 Tax=Paracoccus litorisediminis TaxID=2006130 RepID=UPI00372E9AEF